MIYGILLAAGSGQRFGGDKLQSKINEKPVWEWAFETINTHKLINQVIVVGDKNLRLPKNIKVIGGGKSRFDSLIVALTFLKKFIKKDDIIVVHNAANPFACKKEVSKVIRAASRFGAAAVAGPIYDTIKQISADHKIIATIERQKLRATQTPQALRADVLEKGLAMLSSRIITDEMMIAEIAGIRPQIIPKSENNFKITTEADLILAKIIQKDIPLAYVCGIGIDSHAFAKAKKGLNLGGFHLASESALQANSDGDVILHALINAILSALGDNSFSSFADEMCKKGITDSKLYLLVALEKMRAKKFRINNVAIALEGSRPKIDLWTDKIKMSLSELLNISTTNIGLTSTSGEGLSSFGQGLGIYCQVIISLVQ